MALASKTARIAIGRTVVDAQFLADRVIFMNSKYGMQNYVRHCSLKSLIDRLPGTCLFKKHEYIINPSWS